MLFGFTRLEDIYTIASFRLEKAFEMVESNELLFVGKLRPLCPEETYSVPAGKELCSLVRKCTENICYCLIFSDSIKIGGLMLTALFEGFCVLLLQT